MLGGNTLTEIKGLETLKSLKGINLGLRSGTHLNGKRIPYKIAKKMGMRKGGDLVSSYVKPKEIVKYCQFVKDTGLVDWTTPGIIEAFNEWKRSQNS